MKFSNTAGSSATSSRSCASTKAEFDSIDHKLREAATFQRIGNRLSLRDAAGYRFVSLERIKPDGIEYRSLMIVSYLENGMLRTPNKLGNIDPAVIFFNGRIDGTPGCGGMLGSYVRSARSAFTISASWALAGYCNQLDLAIRQNNAITSDLNGAHIVEEASDHRFFLRDKYGNIQLVLKYGR